AGSRVRRPAGRTRPDLLQAEGRASRFRMARRDAPRRTRTRSALPGQARWLRRPRGSGRPRRAAASVLPRMDESVKPIWRRPSWLTAATRSGRFHELAFQLAAPAEAACHAECIDDTEQEIAEGDDPVEAVQ